MGDELEIAALKSTLATSHAISGYATLAILAGIILELIILFVFAHEISKWEKTALVLANILIATGLAAEYWYGGKGAEAAAELQRISDAKLSEALNRAATAQEELTKFRTPRSKLLTPEVRKLITQKLEPFSGTVYDIAHERIDREQWDFMWWLEPAIRNAGWKQIDWIARSGFVFKKNNWPGDHVYGEMGVINISIEIRPAFRDKYMPAARALAEVLAQIGIKVTTDDDNNSSATNDALHLIVGRKQ